LRAPAGDARAPRSGRDAGGGGDSRAGRGDRAAAGRAGDWADAPADWAPFAARGLRPAADGLAYVFRAITPPGRPRRFDARFFLADAGRARGDLSAASDELSHLHWIALADARGLDLPFITEIVLAEVAEIVEGGGRPASVPFFDNSGSESLFHRLV
jgi:hypothetical protein